jgi:hypothetical protein
MKMLPCAYKSFIGIDCPLCGFQRSILALMGGNIKGSLEFYPPLIPVLILFILIFLNMLKGAKINKNLLMNYYMVVLALITINYTVKMVTKINF